MITQRGLTLTDWPWIKERLYTVLGDDTCGCVVEKDDQLVAAVVLDNFGPNHCYMHVAVDDPMAVAAARLPQNVFRWIFEDIGLEYVLTWTDVTNKHSMRQQGRLGFKPIFILKDGYKPGVDRVLSRLDKDNCKYLEKENGWSGIQARCA